MTVQEIIGRAKSEGRGLLTEVEAKELLKKADINVVDTRLAAWCQARPGNNRTGWTGL
jgi:hypothetical protein